MKNKTKYSPGLGYSGEVTYKIVKNNKVFKQETLHNTGTINLFTALCRSLAGMRTQEAFPAKIQLYKKAAQQLQSLSDLELPSDLGDDLTAPLLYSNIPIIEVDAGIPKVTFQFVIPYALITDPSEITYAILYPNKSNISPGDALAWLDLTSGGATPIESPDLKENVQFLVNWTMKFQNLREE